MTNVFEFVFFVPMDLVFPNEDDMRFGDIQITAKLRESEPDIAFGFLFDDSDYDLNVEIISVKMPPGSHLQDVDIDDDGWAEIESAAKQESYSIIHNHAFNGGGLVFH